MTAKNGHIRYVIAISIAVLLAFSVVAEAESLAEGDSGGSRQPSPSQKRLTPYEILRRSRLQRAAEETPANFSTGPVIATAQLKIVPINRDSPTHYRPKSRCISSFAWGTGTFTASLIAR